MCKHQPGVLPKKVKSEWYNKLSLGKGMTAAISLLKSL